jgi:hypothetical protein
MTRVIIFGDSHVHAVQAANKHRRNEGRAITIPAHRSLKAKQNSRVADGSPSLANRIAKVFGFPGRRGGSGKQIVGDLPLEDLLATAKRLCPEDVIVSMVGGSKHSVLSTIQHPERFDFFLPGQDHRLGKRTTLIPFQLLYDYFRKALRQNDGAVIATLKSSTSAKVVHLLAPPPKRKKEYIEIYHDTRFADEGISELGISPAELRLKFWHLQNMVVQEICDELGVETIPPPAEACEPNGFLKNIYYAGDATHANRAYGELVLQQLEQRFGLAEPLATEEVASA